MDDKDKSYLDHKGNPVDLVTLCHREPEWAANIINRHHEDFVEIINLIGSTTVHVLTESIYKTTLRYIRRCCIRNLPSWKKNEIRKRPNEQNR